MPERKICSDMVLNFGFKKESIIRINKIRGFVMILKNQKGVAAVEFAIVLIFLVPLVFGIIDFALLIYNKQVIINASREGARSAITIPKDKRSDTSYPNNNPAYPQNQKNIITTYCTTPVNRLIDLSGNNVLHSPIIADESVGTIDYIRASVDYDYVYFFGSLFGLSGTTITGETVMRME